MLCCRHLAWLLPVVVTVLITGGELASAVSLAELDRIRLVTITEEAVTLKPTALPYTNASVSSDEGAQSVTEYELSSDALNITFDHTRAARYQSIAMSYGDIYFTVDQLTNYSASGSYIAVDPDGRRVFFEGSITDTTLGSYVFRSVQISNATPNEEFTLGLSEGDTYNDNLGSLVGTLVPGRTYHYTYNVHIESSPSAAASGGTASGSLLLSFTPIPEPSTALLLACGLAGLAAPGRRRA